MMNLLPIYKASMERTAPRRETERDMFLRMARERQLEERRARRRAILGRLTGRSRRAA
jgi:hypothetical protein